MSTPSPNDIPLGSFLMVDSPTKHLRSSTVSARSRTVSTPAHAKKSDELSATNSWSVVGADSASTSTTPFPASSLHANSQSNLSDSPRTRRPSAAPSPYFTIPKTFTSLALFSRRRKPAPRQPQTPQTRSQTDHVLEHVIEIGPEHVKREDGDASNEEEERERLRDAAAAVLGLNLGRESPVLNALPKGAGGRDDEEPEPEPELEIPLADAHSDANPYILDPIPHIPPLASLTLSPPSHSSLSSTPQTPSFTASAVPPYPSALAALTPYIQTRAALHKFHPAASFLALSLSRRTKQWRLHHVILTAPPHAHVPQHAHLHLFRSAAPPLDELEIDRLEINEDSVAFVAERDVVKVGGRDARTAGGSATASAKSAGARSWHAKAPSAIANLEEMGRTMWLLKTPDAAEMQRWIAAIKSAVLMQRAERAGMTFHDGAAPTMRGDLDVLLSLRKQGLLPSVRAAPPAAPNPNPRYAEHVGAAPTKPHAHAHSSPPSSLRALSHPPSAASGFKALFATDRERSKERDKHGDSASERDIDPIADESNSFGNRASTLFNMFRSSSRTSYGTSSRASYASGSSSIPYDNHVSHRHASMVSNATGSTLAPPSHTLGTPITPAPFPMSDGTVRGKPQPAFSVDWSSLDGTPSPTHRHHSGGALSLPPPPRNLRRPLTAGDSARRGSSASNGTAHREEPGSPRGPPPHTPTPPVSPKVSSNHGGSSFRAGRPPSVTSTSSYASAMSDVERANSARRSRTVPKMLAPPTGPPPRAPSLRAQSPNTGPPSPIFEQEYARRNGSGYLHRESGGRLDPAGATWGTQHPYSKRVSTSSARSVNTTSTGHSFLGAKPPPPPRPPPNFAPPPAPTDHPRDGSPTSHRSSPGRESFLPRSLRLSLLPPAAPPTQSLPPRPDEPGFRHRRSNSSEVKSSSSLYPIPGSPPPPAMHPPAPPPPSGPLPPTPDGDKERPLSSNTRYPSLSRRLRIMSTPSPSPSLTVQLQNENPTPSPDPDPPHSIGEPILQHPEDYPQMFLNMSDTPTTPAVPPPSFLHVPMQSAPDDVEPTSLSPPPRRNSRTSKDLRMLNLDKDDLRTLTEPQDSAVVLEPR